MIPDMEELRQWIGRREEARDVATAAAVAGLSAVLDRDDPEPAPGDTVPPGGHWLFFPTRFRQSTLGDDGHPPRGGFLPPVPLPRRMWAGGRLRFHAPLRIGETLRRVSEIRDVRGKEGKTGPLIFVTVRHRIECDGSLALVEDHDLVYRQARDPGAPPPPPPPPKAAPGEAPWTRTLEPDPVLLFRYSALTFNGHRIHYDRRYATEVEGYPGLVVHGPLIATLLLDLCRRQHGDGRVVEFGFRSLRPLFDGRPFTVAGKPTADGAGAELWAADDGGAMAMTANARFA